MPDPTRIIDANLNRASEALRVLEDVARFSLDDANLTARIKTARHALRRIGEAAGLDAARLAAWRDTPQDVGTALSEPGERERRTVGAVAVAAGKRAGEALRVLEEAIKLLPARDGQAHDADAKAKSLRYEIYELEKRVVMALSSSAARQWRLCILISQSLCTHFDWQAVAERAIAGGADALQLREKNLDDQSLLDRARRLVEIARSTISGGTPVSVIINDRPDIALLARADGVHVGQTDLRVSDIRRMAGFSLLVGVSTANQDHAVRAAADGADYCGCGPMFQTSTKATASFAGPAYLRQYLADPRTARLPHLAIGGIDAAGARELKGAGCRGVAASSAVCGSPDPGRACREILTAMGP